MNLRRDALDSAVDLSERLDALTQSGSKRLGLTPVRARTVYALYEHGPLRQKSLAEALDCSTQQVAAIIDALVAKDLVKRAPDPEDRRAVQVTLTRRGRRVAEKVSALRAEVADDLFRELSDDQVREFGSLAALLTGRAAARERPTGPARA